MRILGKVAVLVAGLVSLAAGGRPAAALDPAKAFHHYRLDVWQPEDGLPWNSVTVVLQTSDGYLWLGSYEGLARFDGVRFTVFDTTNTPELRDNVVYGLAETPDGSLWIGTDGGGVTRLAAGTFTSYTTREGLADDRVTDIVTGRDGGLWIATRGGLTRLREGRLISFGQPQGLAEELVWTLAEDRDGVLWIGTDEGLVRFADGRFSSVALGEECRPDCGVSAIAEDGDGHLWIGIFGGGLWRFADGAPVSFRDLGHDPLVIRPDRAGSLWIATNGGGLMRLRGGELAAYGTGAGLVSDTVWSLAEDREGSLWLGTEGGGLHRLRDTRIVSYTTRDGLPHDRAWVVSEDRQGRLWLGTDGGGLARWEEGKIRTYTTRDGLTSDVVTALHAGRDALWIGTLHGLSRWRDGEISPAFTTEIGSDAVIAAVHEGPRGALWIGTHRGLLRLDDGAVTAYGVAEGLPAPGVTALAEDSRGRLWVGTDGGLVIWRDRDLTVPAGAESLAGAFVRAIYVDADTVWVGTRGDGLVRLREGGSVTYTARSGLHSEVIYQILEDGSGNLWMSCNRGIFRVSKAELEEVARGARSTVRSTAYGAADGMTSLECLGGYQPAGGKTRDGRLWFPTTRGVATVDPASLAVNELPPPVHIEQVLADGVAVEARSPDPGATVTLPPGRGELEFHYTALSLVDPPSVRFRYRLGGYDDGWVDAAGRRSAYYTNLGPGSYRFQVIASNNDGVWNEVGAERRLTLRPAFHQTWLFYAACVLAVALAGRGLHLFRVRALRRHNEDLRQVQRLLEVKNAEVEAKSAEMERFTYAVSHDLKSPLFTIQGFLGYLERHLESGDLEQAGRDIRRLRATAAKMEELLHELLELSRIGRIADEPQEVDLGELAREAAELVAGRIAERGVEVVISPRLPAVVGDRRRLLQVLQNLIDNAVKYLGDASAPRLEIGVAEDAARPQSGEADPVFYVRDNGAGIDPRHHRRIFDLFRQLDPEAEGTGMGLVLVKKILEVHGGRIWVESEGEGRGSTFYFTIPRPTSREGAPP